MQVEKRFTLTFPEGIVLKLIHAVGKFENKLIAVIGTTTLDKDGCFNYPETLVVKTWNIETEEPLQSLQMETIENRIRSVLIYNNLITALADPYAAFVYNIQTEKVDFIRHCASIVCHNNDKIAMAIHTGSVVILDLDYTELVKLNICGSERAIVEIQMNGNYLIILTGSHTELDERISIWNIETKTQLYEVEKIHLDTTEMFFHENKLFYTCGEYQEGKIRCRLCDLDTGNCILDLAPGNAITRNSFVLKGDISNHRLLKLWSIRTGKLVADVQLPKPLPYEFYQKCRLHTKTKSKVVYLHYNQTIAKWTLQIMDFEANI